MRVILLLLALLVPAGAQVFTYITGPDNCSAVAGFPNPPTCTLPAVTIPAVGETYTDPNFGATVRTIGATPTTHAYSTPTSLSPDGQYVILRAGFGGQVSAVDAKSGAVVRNLSAAGVPLEETVWAQDGNIYFVSGAMIRRYVWATSTAETVIDYSAAPWSFSSITTGGAVGLSRDDWWGFEARTQNRACIVDIHDAANRTYCHDFSTVTPVPSATDSHQVAKGLSLADGCRYSVLAATPVAHVFKLCPGSSVLQWHGRGPELRSSNGNNDGICDPGEWAANQCLTAPHMDTGQDGDGRQLIVAGSDGGVDGCDHRLVGYNMASGAPGLPSGSGGGLHVQMKIFGCALGEWPSYHIGCSSKRTACVLSTFHRSTGLADRGPHVGENIVADLGVTARIRRVNIHRAVGGYVEYWRQPHTNIGWSGTTLIYSDDFSVDPTVMAANTGLTLPRRRR